MIYNKYKRMKKQYSEDGGLTWKDYIPYEYILGELVEADSEECGSDGVEPIYRWVDEEYCEGYNLMKKRTRQVSNDNGVSWKDTGEVENSLVKANSPDCGYVEPTTYTLSVNWRYEDKTYLNTDNTATIMVEITPKTEADITPNDITFTKSSGSDFLAEHPSKVEMQIVDMQTTYVTIDIPISNTTEDDVEFVGKVRIEGLGETVNTFRIVQKGKEAVNYTMYVSNDTYNKDYLYNDNVGLLIVQILPKTDANITPNDITFIKQVGTTSDFLPEHPFRVVLKPEETQTYVEIEFLMEDNNLYNSIQYIGKVKIEGFGETSNTFAVTKMGNANINPEDPDDYSQFAGENIKNHPYYNRFFTIEALEEGPVKFYDNTDIYTGMYYSINSGWWTAMYENRIFYLQKGDKLRLKKTANDNYATEVTSIFSSVPKCKIYGNINSMYAGDNFLIDVISYGSMFQYFLEGTDVVDTSNLVIPYQKALYGFCYGMFKQCSSLEKAPGILPAMTLDENCYSDMFDKCISLTKPPVLPATTLAEACYMEMFYGCSKLNYIKCLAETNINVNLSTYRWVYNVSSTGTFVKKRGVTWPSGSNGIPSGWTIEEID